MTNVNLEIRTWRTREASDDGWDRGDTNGEVVGIDLSRDFLDYNGFETDLKPPFFVVYAEYMDGDTFGSDFHASVLGVFEDFEEAEEFAWSAEGSHGFSFQWDGRDYYTPWNGYFARLLNIKVEQASQRLTIRRR